MLVAYADQRMSLHTSVLLVRCALFCPAKAVDPKHVEAQPKPGLAPRSNVIVCVLVAMLWSLAPAPPLEREAVGLWR